MKRLAGIAGLMALLAIIAGIAVQAGGGGRVYAEEPPQEGTLSVTGSATVTATPDEATLDLTVSALEDSAVGAITSASTAMNDVIAAVFAQGIATEDIRTTSISLRPEYEFALDRRILVGFRFTNSIRVTVRDIDDVGPVIDSAVVAGGNLLSLDNIAFQISNRSLLEDQARLGAIDDAIRKASAMADRAGLALGRVISMREVGFFTPTPIVFEAAPAPSFATPVFTGTQEITSRVEMVFVISG